MSMKVVLRSAWDIDGAVAFAECEASDAGAAGHEGEGGAARFEASLASPVVLRCPSQAEESETDGRASVPCELTVEWAPQPRRCRSLQLEVLTSARHVELFADGTRHNLLGEQERGEVYLGTFRGARRPDDPLQFAISERFEQQNSEHNVIGSLVRLRVKFVSLVGDKRALQLHDLRCVYDAIPDTPVPVMPTASNVVSALAGLGLGGASSSDASAPDTSSSDVLAFLASAQQSMMQQMEDKIASAMDAKLALLSQRLAFSEQQIFKLHQRIDSANSEQKASVDTLEGKLASIEASIAALGKLGNANEQQQQPAE